MDPFNKQISERIQTVQIFAKRIRFHFGIEGSDFELKTNLVNCIWFCLGFSTFLWTMSIKSLVHLDLFSIFKYNSLCRTNFKIYITITVITLL